MTDSGTDPYERFFKALPAMLGMAGFDGRFTELNPAWEQELGFSAAEMSGRLSLDFIHPEDRAAVSANLQRIYAGESQATFETRGLCKDGSCKWLFMRWAADREKNRIYVAAADISAMKQAAQAHRESENTLHKIIDSAPMSMSIVAMDGTIEYINRKAVETFGYSHADIPDMDRWWALAYPEENYRKEVVARWMGRVQDAFTKKSEIDGGEYRVTCKDGTQKTVFIFGVITAGKVFAMFDDITRRVEAEKALRESESLYRSLIETTGTGYHVIDGHGRTLDANREYVRLSGHSDLKEIMGHTVSEWTAPHEKERNAKAVEQCARDGYLWNFEVDYIDKTGKLTPVEINATVVTRGGVPQILALCRDITSSRRRQEEIRILNQGLEIRVAERTAELTAANKELISQIAQRREAEKARETLQEELLQSQKMELVGELAGGIAHDFNNILVAISGYAEFLLKSMPESAPAREDLSEIISETERGATLTRQLTSLSRKQPLQLQVLDLNEVTSGACRMLSRLIGASMHLETRLTPGIDKIKSDPGQISQVIMNLVVNARDAMSDGGRIIIETANAEIGEEKLRMPLPPGPGHYVRLSVSDNGSGMTLQTMSRLFEPFFTTKEKGKGTGLGLSIIYGIVRQAHGGIDVESVPGRGTTFSIYLPRTLD